MDMECIVLTIGFWVLIEANTTPADFSYTLCKWYNSRCTLADPLEYIASDDETRSEWPSGPYALLTSSEGCPESGAEGWRRGYLYFTWKHPQTLTLATDCGVNDKTDQSDESDEESQEAVGNTNQHNCFRSLIPDSWPDLKSRLLGPFSKHAWRLNFCFKVGNHSVFEEENLWPVGSYSVFGDDKSCPAGFTASERTIKLPAINSWTSNGYLPGFVLTTNETDSSVMLVLKLCEHRTVETVENETNEFQHERTFPTDSYIFIKNDDNSSCPQLQHTNVEIEKLQLHANVNGSDEITKLFDICYCRPDTLPKDVGNYLLIPQNVLSSGDQPAFAIVNPTLIYGNRTILNSSQDNYITRLTLPQIYQQIVTPWFLVDLGRNFIIVGLQFKNYFLTGGNSEFYLGSLNKTVSGYVCQRWDSQIPHRHNFSRDDNFPDKTVSDAQNYCRDPSDDGKIWCYTNSAALRSDTCADEIFLFEEANRPFSKCYISEERWRLGEFGGTFCQYTVSYYGILFYKFQRDFEGRYIKLVGQNVIDSSKFYSGMENLQVLTSGKVLYDGSKCNTDLGMGDESINEHQISASSWFPEAPPASSRPFSTGWCAYISDTDPYIAVDMMANTMVEGITFFNWEITDTQVYGGKYKKKYLPIGSKEVRVHYSTEDLMTYTNKTYSLDMFLPVEQPQSFYHNPIQARYIIVYIMESMSTSSKCIRFELHGCKQNARPELVLATWTLRHSSLSDEEAVTFNNLQILKESSEIRSIAYPLHYSGGETYYWIVDFPEGRFIQFIFSEMSLKSYELSDWNQCQDKLTFLPTYKEDAMFLDKQFNGLVSLIETNHTYMTLTFTTCRPTAKLTKVGNGFKAIIGSKETPTCFSSTRNSTENIVQYYCSQQTMFITSLSQLNFPASTVPEEWIIHVKRVSIQLRILYFNVRCDPGSLFTITDRFSGRSSFCNLNKPPTEWYSDSDTVHIRLKTRQMLETDSNGRISSREGFKALYRTFHKSMADLLDMQKAYTKAILRHVNLETYWDPAWTNATLLTYQGCSKKIGKCYYIYSGAITSWKQAGKECWIRQSRLVSIHSDVEHELIKYILRNFRFLDRGNDTPETAFSSNVTDPNYFSHIGLSRVTSKTGIQLHMWEDGSPITFSAWKKDEPSTKGDCTRMSFHLLNTNDTWEAESCETGLASFFICEQHLTDAMLKTVFPHMYNGTLNVTLSGLSCQRWDTQYPHQHNYTKGYQFPEQSASDAENFCRDPSRAGYIWCYTEDPYRRYEKCSEDAESDDSPIRRYTGQLSRTSSGRTCQRWDSQYPHTHYNNEISLFPDASMEDVANHCRDPTESGMLWCYTTDRYSRWESCDLEDTAEDRCHVTHSVYSGQWNRTRSGIACQPWTSQWPHNHEHFVDSQFPDGSVTAANNYCRDPYNEGFLWCFTIDPATKSESCVFDYKYQLRNFTSELTYTNETFLCTNGDVMLAKYLCNGIPDCPDLSDEVDCTHRVHDLMLNIRLPAYSLDTENKYSLFQCESKEWVSMLARCDRVIDCSDASDEINCSSSEVSGKPICNKGEYTCQDGGCIHISQMCDFIIDCADGSDENCDYQLCSQTEYRCRNQQCIPNEDRCNAYENCLDGSDEEDCDLYQECPPLIRVDKLTVTCGEQGSTGKESRNTDVCKANSFHCDLVRCIPRTVVCDKYIDCKDETDEVSCGQPIYFSCERLWYAGYRKSGHYKLNETQVECNFDDVNKDGTVYTIIHNFELTLSTRHLMTGIEQVYFAPTDGPNSSINPKLIATHFRNKNYKCFQNATQSCIPAYEALSDYQGNAKEACPCITMTMAPYQLNISTMSLHLCEDKRQEPDHTKIKIAYMNRPTPQLYILNISRDLQVTVGPIVCSNVRKLDLRFEDVGIVSKEFQGPRCVFDTDSVGFINGSRSGQHLQGCEYFDCPENTVKCPDSFCLPLKFICDGEIQCPGGQDEEECGCQNEDREVILLREDWQSQEQNQKIQKIATQFYTADSIVRELRYKATSRSDKLEYNHRFLDILDTMISPYNSINRELTCNYTILASDFINRIEFSKTFRRGIIFFQTSNESEILADMMFAKIRSKPEFLIYRIIHDPFHAAAKRNRFPFVVDIVVKSWSTLVAVGAKYFPELCQEAATVYCPNMYKCSASKTCISMEQVCDGQAQCLYGDDERSCKYTCPVNCTCEEYTTDCSFADLDNNTLPYLHKSSRMLELSGNTGLRDVLRTPIVRFPYLISLNVSMCDIKEIERNVFQTIVNLRMLDLSFNKLKIIPSSAFIGLMRLKVLNLAGNRDIYLFAPYSMSGLSSIRSIEITGANIYRMSSHAFNGLNLDQLTLSDNTIQEMEDDVFSGLNVKVINMETNIITNFNQGLFRGLSGITTLHTPAFKFCCVRPNYLSDEDCFPGKDEFSSCADLLRVSALQTMLWFIGILSLFGNILSVIYRLVYDRERLKLGFGIFVTNLAVADFLMGIYLIIIAIADATFRTRYIFMDDYWRNSTWCALAGFLSTVSSEASVFFLCLITLDRFLVIKYPFGQVRFSSKSAVRLSGVAWVISVFVGLLPILYKGYFQDKFYSKSGVCIALPLTRDRPPGWLYSIIIFVGLNFVTFCLIAVGQIIIFMEIKKVTSGIRHSSTNKGKGGTGRRRELAVARNLLFIVTTDFLCWFPIGCMGLMALSGRVIPGEVYAWTAVFILPVNSALNPLLYTLTAILGKKKSKGKRDVHTPPSHSTDLPQQGTRSFKGLFRYFMMKVDSPGQTFVSLDNLGNKDINLNSKDVIKIVHSLTRCICLLHKSSLMVHLYGNIVYVSVMNDKVIGDVQIRQEPSECSIHEMRKENMHQLGYIVRLLLAISKKTRDHHEICIDNHKFCSEKHK